MPNPSWQAKITVFILRLVIKPISRFCVWRYQRSKSLKYLYWTRKKIDSFKPLLAANVHSVVANGVPAKMLYAASSTHPMTLLYLHGGAYLLCSSSSHQDLVNRIATYSGCNALIIDYRLAPEHPFPAALEDAIQAYEWLSQQLSPSQIVIAGDSAGGGLALALLVALKNAQKPLPAGAILLSPWLDLALTGKSWHTNRRKDAMLVVPPVDLYLQGADPEDIRASPIYADLHGLPPLLTFVGDTEVLLDDALKLKAKATEAQVPITLHVGNKLPHVWPIFDYLPESKAALLKMAAFIQHIRTGQTLKP